MRLSANESDDRTAPEFPMSMNVSLFPYESTSVHASSLVFERAFIILL
jgi:hypothetical protein